MMVAGPGAIQLYLEVNGRPVHGELIKSRRNGSLVQPSTVPQPMVPIETDW